MRTLKCNIKMIMVFVADMTEKDPNYKFTSKKIAESFSCNKQSVSHMFKRLVSFGNITMLKDTFDDGHSVYKITPSGVKYVEHYRMSLIGKGVVI